MVLEEKKLTVTPLMAVWKREGCRSGFVTSRRRSSARTRATALWPVSSASSERTAAASGARQLDGNLMKDRARESR